MVRLTAWLLVGVLVLDTPVAFAGSSSASAQQDPKNPPQQAAPDPSAAPSPDVVDRMPISLDRIKRALAEKQGTAGKDDPLRLQYYVEVYGVAPPIDIFRGENLSGTGSIRYGGMTHQEFLDLVTPIEYRAGAVPWSALVFWLAQKLADKNKEDEQQKENERRKKEYGIQ